MLIYGMSFNTSYMFDVVFEAQLKGSMNCSVPSLREVYFQVLHVAGEIFEDMPAGNHNIHNF